MSKNKCNKKTCVSCIDGECICLSEKIDECPFFMSKETRTIKIRECAERLSKLPNEQQLYIRDKYVMQGSKRK